MTHFRTPPNRLARNQKISTPPPSHHYGHPIFGHVVDRSTTISRKPPLTLMFAQVQQEIVDGAASPHPSVPQQLHVAVGGRGGRRVHHHFAASFRSGPPSELCARTDRRRRGPHVCFGGCRPPRVATIDGREFVFPVGSVFYTDGIRFPLAPKIKKKKNGKRPRNARVHGARIVCAARLRDGGV